MANLRISADTSEVKRSLLELGKTVKNLGSSKVSVFSEKDRQFIKSELNRELTLMKTKLKENRAEISKLVSEQNKVTRGSKEELDNRKKIIDAYKTQTRLARDMSSAQGMLKGGGIGGLSSWLTKGLGLAAGAVGAGALTAVAYGGARTMQAGSQYAAGAANRVRLRGLGFGENFGSPQELAGAGLNEQDFVQRQIRAGSRLGRTGASRESILQQAQFERGFGLEGGTMTNAATALRANFGGQGADQAQQKIQASILAAGIEDAVGPYLEAATDLLSKINDNGITNTDEMTAIFAQLVRDGQRTPEQISAAFQSMDSAIRGSKGEANAFLQNAFARGGIGGGTIGATRLAIESGGIFGLNPEELKKRGYNQELIKQMQGAGFSSGAGGRSSAILNQFKTSAGMGSEQRISDISDMDQATQLSHMANSVFGTQGMGGMDALMMLEQVQAKKMTQGQFESKMKDMMERRDPQVERLNKINDTLSGQLTVQKNIRDNFMERLGKRGGAQVRMLGTEADIQGISATTNTVGAINDTGAIDKARGGVAGAGNWWNSGQLGDSIHTALWGSESYQNEQALQEGARRFKKRGLMPGSSAQTGPAPDDAAALAKAVETGMTKAMQAQKAKEVAPVNNLNVKIQNGDGTVSNKTHR